MTIKKLALSTVTAAIVTSGAVAGTLTATSQTFSKEGLTTDAGMLRTDLNTSYTVSILGTLNQGSVIYNMTNVDINDTSVLANANVRNSTAGTIVTSSCAAGSTGQIICDINDTITSGDVLILTSTATPTALGFPLDLNVSAGTTSATVSTQLTNSATTLIDSGAAATTLGAVTVWGASVTSTFANQIDASDSFLSFISTADANASITITETSTDLNSTNSVALSTIWSIMPDQNTSAFGEMYVNAGAENQGRDNNYSSTAISVAGVYQADFTPDATNAIAEATFTTSLPATFGTNTVNLIAAATDFGAFTVYGYNGNIPGASYSDGVTDTIITLVNNQTTATADTVVVIKDADGDTCTLTSTTDAELNKPTANSSTKYRLSEMLVNSKCSALTGTSFSIKVSLPTTPTNVFANAFVKNSTINQFKVLPVYNNGTSY